MIPGRQEVELTSEFRIYIDEGDTFVVFPGGYTRNLDKVEVRALIASLQCWLNIGKLYNEDG